MCVWVCTCASMHACMYVCVCVCVCIYIYIYIYACLPSLNCWILTSVVTSQGVKKTASTECLFKKKLLLYLQHIWNGWQNNFIHTQKSSSVYVKIQCPEILSAYRQIDTSIPYMLVTLLLLITKGEGKESRKRPGVAQRVPRGLGSQISWHLAYEGGEIFSLTPQLPLSQGMFLILIFTRGWVDPGAMVWSEGNMSLKNPVTTPGINPGTVRLVAQHLNHYATSGPITHYYCHNFTVICLLCF